MSAENMSTGGTGMTDTERLLEEERKHQDELWAEYIEELEEKRDNMIGIINKMGVDELELMLEMFDDFQVRLFKEGV